MPGDICGCMNGFKPFLMAKCFLFSKRIVSSRKKMMGQIKSLAIDTFARHKLSHVIPLDLGTDATKGPNPKRCIHKKQNRKKALSVFNTTNIACYCFVIKLNICHKYQRSYRLVQMDRQGNIKYGKWHAHKDKQGSYGKIISVHIKFKC